MEFVERYFRRTVSLSIAAAVFLACCSDDEAPTTPDQGEESGTIVIDQAPNLLTGASWSLTGPQDEIGSGDTTLASMPTGTYTIVWDDVSGYISPFDDEQTLAADGTITFAGIYTPDYFVLIPAGTFLMGSPADEALRGDNETQHTVTLTTPFYMSSVEVTNAQYVHLAQWAFNNGYCTATSTAVIDALDGSTDILMELDYSTCEIRFSLRNFTVEPGTEEHPVRKLTWYGAAAYCDWLSLRDDLPRAYDHFSWLCNYHQPYDARGYRLPTEAEWEYACRAGTQTPFNTGECLDAETEANYNGSWPYTGCPAGPCVGWTTPVGSYPANTFGLYDMHANVREWCNDWYDGLYEGDVTNPVGPFSATARVCRGGDYFNPAAVARSANRNANVPFSNYSGFRPVRSAE